MLALGLGCGGVPSPLPDNNGDADNDGGDSAPNGDQSGEGQLLVIVNTDPLSRHAAQIQMPDGTVVRNCWAKRDEAGNIEYVSHFRVISADAQVEHLQIDALGHPLLFVDSSGFGFRVDEYLDDDQALVTYFNASGDEEQVIVNLGASGDYVPTGDLRDPETDKAPETHTARWGSDAACEAMQAGVEAFCLSSNIFSIITATACGALSAIVGLPPTWCVAGEVTSLLVSNVLCGGGKLITRALCGQRRREPLDEPNPPDPLPCIGTFTDWQGDICGGWATIIVEPGDNWHSSTWLTIDNLCASSTWVNDNTLVLTGHAWGGGPETRGP